MNIRLAQSADKEAIDVITHHFADNSYEHSGEFFDEAIQSGRIFIAYIEGKPAGYLVYQVLWGNTPFLALVRVMPTFQGLGIGSALLKEFEDKLKNEGFDAYLSSSEMKNQQGNEFHERKGFEQIGELNMLYGKEVFYKKNL